MLTEKQITMVWLYSKNWRKFLDQQMLEAGAFPQISQMCDLEKSRNNVVKMIQKSGQLVKNKNTQKSFMKIVPNPSYLEDRY